MRGATAVHGRSAVVVWCIQGVYLTGWAALGIVLWIPQLLGASLLWAISLVRRALKGTKSPRPGREVSRAADLYGRFVGVMESVRTNGGRTPSDSERRRGPWRTLGVIAWAVLVWYLVLWPAGVVRVTPVELGTSLTAISGLFAG